MRVRKQCSDLGLNGDAAPPSRISERPRERRRPLSKLPLLLAGAIALAVGCARNDTDAPAATADERKSTKVILQTDWFPQGEHGGYYQALAKGFYAEAGLAVDIRPGGPGAGIKLKVARGDAHFGMLRSDDVILATGNGMPFVMVAATMQHDAQGLMVHAGSPVKTFKDLDGRVVIGNVGMAWFPYLEKRFEIKIERRQNTYGLGEFIANPDIIQQCLITNEPFFAEKNGRKIRTLPLSSSGYDCYQTVFTRRDFIRTSPEVIRAFVQASIRGWRDYLDGDPAPANEIILKRNREMTPELLTFSRDEMIRHAFVRGDPGKGEDIGRLSLERIADQMKTLVDLEILPRPVPVSDVATTEFLPK
ncbi:MAG: ABC transporter substrate-binding protein [Opitutaceae bacterium]